MMQRTPKDYATTTISTELLEDPRYDVLAIIKAGLEERIAQRAQREHELKVQGIATARESVGILAATEAT